MQAADGWSLDACCSGNNCGYGICHDYTSSPNWLFGLWPGPPRRSQASPPPSGWAYRTVWADHWPEWGEMSDLVIGGSGAPGGSGGTCVDGGLYRGGNFCGGQYNWGKTDVEVWYPLDPLPPPPAPPASSRRLFGNLR